MEGARRGGAISMASTTGERHHRRHRHRHSSSPLIEAEDTTNGSEVRVRVPTSSNHSPLPSTVRHHQGPYDEASEGGSQCCGPENEWCIGIGVVLVLMILAFGTAIASYIHSGHPHEGAHED